MFNHKDISEAVKPVMDGPQPEIERDGFDKYEEKYHTVHTMFDSWADGSDNEEHSLEWVENVLVYDVQEARVVAEKIDEHLDAKWDQIEDYEHVDVDVLFSDDDFIEIIKPYGDEVALPALVYWTTMKQSFLSFQAIEVSDTNDTSVRDIDKHGNRVRAVTDLLISLNPLTTIARFGYTFVTGKTPEPVLEKMDVISEKIVDASDATLYLATSAGVGAIGVVENAAEYGGAAVEYLCGHKEKAEEILSLNISEDMKAKLDDIYGRDNWVSAISTSAEKFGATATYIGLGTLLSAGGITAVGAGAGLVLGKAGEKTKGDIRKTGELSDKEMLHGLLAGASMLAFAELGNAGAEALNMHAPDIAREIYKLTEGKIDPRLLKSITASVVNGLEAGTMFAAYDIPEQISNELERALNIDPDEKGNWKEVLGGAAIAFATASTFTMVKELYENRGFYSTYEERLNKTPKNNGEWTGERGESKFISDNEDVNALLSEKGLDGIEYSDAIPDFSEMSKGTVEIDNMTAQRRGKGNNFDQANIKLAEAKGCEPSDVARWMDKNNYVWHECNDMKTMQKIPFDINDKFGHLGGVGECKRRDNVTDELLGRNEPNGGLFDE